MLFPRSRFLAAGAAAAALAPRIARAQSLTPVTIGMTTTDDASALLIGVQTGIFRRAGLDINVQKAPSGSATAEALAGGTYTFGSVSAITMVTAFGLGVPLLSVAPGGLYNSTTDFVVSVVKKDSPIQTARDLNGSTIGSAALQDLNTVSMMAWIDQHGGDSKTIRVIEVPYPALIAAVDEGRIAMATMIQPILSSALASGKVRMFAKTYDAIAPRFYITTWMTRSSYANDNADVCRRFASAIREANAYANAHRPETTALLAPFSGMQLDTILHGGRDTFATAAIDAADIQPVVDAAVKYKILPSRFDAKEMIAPAVRGQR
jgi:NitT/TauT family transport system substrate-binding protein